MTASEALQNSFQCVQQWALSRWATLTLFVWAFLEAIVWFILPDFLLVMLGVAAPNRRYRFLAVALFASFLGMMAMLFLCATHPLFVEEWLFALPFTPRAMLDAKLPDLFEQWGMWAGLLQSVSGVPVKVWLYGMVQRLSASLTGTQFILILFCILVSRGLRMWLILEITHWLSRKFNGVIKRFWLCWVSVYTALFFMGLVLTSR